MNSPQERATARASFDCAGLSIRQFAIALGVDPATVHRVLNGDSNCKRGNSHRVAVVLGLKRGVLTEDDPGVALAKTMAKARELLPHA